MRRELHYFSIMPKTVLEGEESRITIRPTSPHMRFAEGSVHRVTVIPMTEPACALEQEKYPFYEVTAQDNALVFSHTFNREQEYNIWFTVDAEQHFIALSVYCLKEDLYRRIPLRGDLHVHSTFSDGAEAPEEVAANYRRAGFDFMVVSDHSEYGGSVAACNYWAAHPTDLTIVHGEEVHAPDNHIHIVNFGGDFSVNKLFQEDEERYYREVREIEKSLHIPPEAGRVNAFEYASSVWIYEHIRQGNGLSIFAHPYWTVDAYHVSEDMTRYQFKNGIFDAFELIGGLFPKENNLQVSLYMDILSRGESHAAVVGSSDSHGTTPEPFEGSWYNNPVDNPHGFNEFQTIVFAPANEKQALVDAVKAHYSVAVEKYTQDTYPRVYGEHRLVSYALFLLSEYFPLHDELCYEEGRLMKALVAESEPDADERLAALSGRVPQYQRACFGVPVEG